MGKGDVIPTVGGGKQVVFNDVEVLTQESPVKADPARKRSYEEYRGIGDRIADLENRGIGGGAGYMMARLIGADETASRTTAIETSMKSSAFGFLLACLHFGDYM